MLLASVIGPNKNFQAGTCPVPPPAAEHASMVLWMAAVFNVLPSPTAPKLVMLKTAWGITGNGMSCAGAPEAPAKTRAVRITPKQAARQRRRKFIF